MRRRPFQMSFRERAWLYPAFLLSVASGGAWAVIWHFFREDPTMAEPIENTILKVHLAGAMILLVVIGAALPKHAAKAWAAKINRVASTIFIATILGSAVTGYALNAFFWETSLMHFIHIASGVSMVMMLPAHILIGRFLEKKRIEGKVGRGI